jgi:hypothetical protein
MSNEFKNIKIIAEEAAKHSNCLITDVIVDSYKDAFTVVFQPQISFTIDINGFLLRNTFAPYLVSVLARHMKQTSNDILAFLNSIDDGTVEKAESDIKIEFSLGAKPPQSTI